MYNYITAKLVRAGESRIPPGGLRQDMIHGDIELHSDDILKSDDLMHNKIWEDIQRFIIIRAIKSDYLKVSRRYTLTTLSPLCRFLIFFLQRGLSILPWVQYLNRNLLFPEIIMSSTTYSGSRWARLSFATAIFNCIFRSW